jgi:hypothetical protein
MWKEAVLSIFILTMLLLTTSFGFNRNIRQFATSPPPTLNTQGVRKISLDIDRP